MGWQRCFPSVYLNTYRHKALHNFASQDICILINSKLTKELDAYAGNQWIHQETVDRWIHSWTGCSSYIVITFDLETKMNLTRVEMAHTGVGYTIYVPQHLKYEP